jgi:hypothetical protein
VAWGDVIEHDVMDEERQWRGGRGTRDGIAPSSASIWRGQSKGHRALAYGWPGLGNPQLRPVGLSHRDEVAAREDAKFGAGVPSGGAR